MKSAESPRSHGIAEKIPAYPTSSPPLPEYALRPNHSKRSPEHRSSKPDHLHDLPGILRTQRTPEHPQQIIAYTNTSLPSICHTRTRPRPRESRAVHSIILTPVQHELVQLVKKLDPATSRSLLAVNLPAACCLRCGQALRPSPPPCFSRQTRQHTTILILHKPPNHLN